jgi:hypothetical protein
MSVFKIPVAFLSSSRMRGSILCSLYLWIPAYAGMTGESLRNPGPELAEGRPVALLSSSRMRGSILVLYYCLQAHPLRWVGLLI